MSQMEGVRWGHFILRVRQGPHGLVWVIEDLASGETASFESPYDMLAFIRTHLIEKEDDVPAVNEVL